MQCSSLPLCGRSHPEGSSSGLLRAPLRPAKPRESRSLFRSNHDRALEMGAERLRTWCSVGGRRETARRPHLSVGVFPFGLEDQMSDRGHYISRISLCRRRSGLPGDRANRREGHAVKGAGHIGCMEIMLISMTFHVWWNRKAAAGISSE